LSIFIDTNRDGRWFSNLSVGAIEYGAGASAWLSARLIYLEIFGPTLELTARPGSLAAGTYTADVPVFANGAPNSPLRARVTLVVTNPPSALAHMPAHPPGQDTQHDTPLARWTSRSADRVDTAPDQYRVGARLTVELAY
jgi:hypothetical protein